MKLPWFKRIDFLYLPINLMGWLVLLVAIFYVVYTFIDIDSQSHSVSDTLINFVFNLLIIGAIYSLIAFATNAIKKNNK